MELESFLNQMEITKGLLDLGVVGAGVLRGYFSAAGLDLSSVEGKLLFGVPIFAQTFRGVYSQELKYPYDKEDDLFPISGAGKGAMLGTLEFSLGYSIGYAFSSFFK